MFIAKTFIYTLRQPFRSSAVNQILGKSARIAHRLTTFGKLESRSAASYHSGAPAPHFSMRRQPSIEHPARPTRVGPSGLVRT